MERTKGGSYKLAFSHIFCVFFYRMKSHEAKNNIFLTFFYAIVLSMHFIMSNKNVELRELKNSDDPMARVAFVNLFLFFTCCCCLIEHSIDYDDVDGMNLFTNTKRSRIKFDIKKDPFLLLCHAPFIPFSYFNLDVFIVCKCAWI